MPYPTGMSDRAIWQRRFPISSNADFVSGLDGTFVHRSRKVLKLRSILWLLGVFLRVILLDHLLLERSEEIFLTYHDREHLGEI